MNKEYENEIDRTIAKQFRKTEQRLMEDICRRIKKEGRITTTADYELHRLEFLGQTGYQIRRLLYGAARSAGTTINKLYDQAMQDTHIRDKELYKAKGKDHIPYKDNEEFQRLAEGLKRQTNERLGNLTNSSQVGFTTIGKDGKKKFHSVPDFVNKRLDQVMVDIASGAVGYEEGIRHLVRDMTNSGLRAIDYGTGKSDRVDVAARRAILTGLNQLSGQMAIEDARRLGTNLFEVDWHEGARTDGSHGINDHAWWQGKVYTLDGLREICGYGQVTGLQGANCYHYFLPFVEGVSQRAYTDEALEQLYKQAQETIEYDGKANTLYGWTQEQRRKEVEIRAQREKIACLKAAGIDGETLTIEKCKYQLMLDRYREMCDALDLKTQKERIYTGAVSGRLAPSRKEYAEYLRKKAGKGTGQEKAYGSMPEEDIPYATKYRDDLREEIKYYEAQIKKADQERRAAKSLKERDEKTIIGSRLRQEKYKREYEEGKLTKEIQEALDRREQKVLSKFERINNPSISDALNNSNPGRFAAGEAWRYSQNCTKCAWAYELRRRGYNVKALPVISSNLSEDPFCTGMWRTAGSIEGKELDGIQIFGNSGYAIMSNAITEILKAEKGSRFFVCCQWRIGGGHLFNAEVENGVVRFLNPQKGNEYNLDDFKKMEPGTVGIFRSDTAKVGLDILKAVEEMK